MHFYDWQETLFGEVLKRLGTFGDRTAMRDGLSGRSVTFKDLKTGIERTAAGIADRGIHKGDVS
jgi:non-ribosomal peptide synthetase component E (peptide arylation enzyme)